MMYHCPCDDCTRARCEDFRNCEKFKAWIRWNWKRFNAYAREASKPPKCVETGYWGYRTPDEYRDYIANGVCGGCEFKGICKGHCDQWKQWNHECEEYGKRLKNVQTR